VNRNTSRTLVLGGAIIVVTNAIALGGVAYNRSGEPESTFELTEREAPRQVRYGPAGDDSGLDLRLQWRMPQYPATSAAGDTDGTAYAGGAGYGVGAWLDRKKLAALGIDTSHASETQEDREYYERRLGRDVFLVLELDGPAYAGELAAAHARAERAREAAAAHPDDKGLASEAKGRHAYEERERGESSRLYLVDAGLDPDALRRAYPARSMYAVVRGHVRPAVVESHGAVSELVGQVTHVRCDTINVPARYRRAIGADDTALPRRSDVVLRYSATVAFGRRFEPSLVAVRRTQTLHGAVAAEPPETGN